MVWVGRDLKDHLVPTPLPWAGTSSTRPLSLTDGAEPSKQQNPFSTLQLTRCEGLQNAATSPHSRPRVTTASGARPHPPRPHSRRAAKAMGRSYQAVPRGGGSAAGTRQTHRPPLRAHAWLHVRAHPTPTTTGCGEPLGAALIVATAWTRPLPRETGPRATAASPPRGGAPGAMRSPVTSPRRSEGAVGARPAGRHHRRRHTGPFPSTARSCPAHCLMRKRRRRDQLGRKATAGTPPQPYRTLPPPRPLPASSCAADGPTGKLRTAPRRRPVAGPQRSPGPCRGRGRARTPA